MEGLSLKINDRFINRAVDLFNEVSFSLKHNSIGDTFGLKIYFDPDNIEHRELMTVSHYHIVQLFFNGELIFTGNMIKHKFRQSSVIELASIGGYSLTGVLEDCEIPTSLYPLQYDKLSLAEIARKLIRPFKLDMIIDSSVKTAMNKSFDTSNASESQTVKDYLTELASQKDIIISHNEKGNLLFTSSKTEKKPILDFDLSKGSIPGVSFETNYDGQGMHSEITVQKQADMDGGNAGESKVRNPYVVGSVFRPTVKSQTSGDDNDTKLAARRARAKELRGISLTIEMDRWDIDGEIIKPNNIITILAPKLYIYRKEEFFIESIDFEGDQKSNTATLNCVLPEVYNTKDPVNIFRGINLHPLES